MLVKSSRESTVAGQEPGDLGRGAAAPRRNEIIIEECILQRHVLFVLLSPPFPLAWGGAGRDADLVRKSRRKRSVAYAPMGVAELTGAERRLPVRTSQDAAS